MQKENFGPAPILVDPVSRPWWAFWRTTAADPMPEPSIAAVMSQWAEYEIIFNDILQRLNAQLARQAKYQKKQNELLTREESTPHGAGPPAAPILSGKQALRSAYAAQRYGGRIAALQNAKEQRDVSIGESGEIPIG